MLNDIIKKMEGYPNEFRFIEQKNTDIESFFKENLKCKYVPKEVLEFYQSFDGFSLSFVNEVFSLELIKTYYKDFDEFLASMEIKDNNKRFIPIANDGMGGLYVFSSDTDDKKIYYLDHEYPDNIVEFDDFYSFLEHEYELAVDVLTEE